MLGLLSSQHGYMLGLPKRSLVVKPYCVLNSNGYQKDCNHRDQTISNVPPMATSNIRIDAKIKFRS